MPTPSTKKAKFIKPANTLKKKVGDGGISPTRIQRAEEVLKNFNADFTPYAQKMLAQLDVALKEIEPALKNNQSYNTDSAVFPIMQLKANGAMFKFQLITDVADICLQFLEAIPKYNLETILLIRAHENAIRTILKNDLRGDGDKEGYALVQELHKACQRYFKKYEEKNL